jgi:hypothetical protein
VNKLLIILTFLTSVAWAENDHYADIEKGLKVYGEKVKKLKQHIDNSVFQDQEILIELDFDAKQLISFVQEKIAFQPYQGLLRGVQGTLNSRAGNALDQSVLLAKMLNDAGLNARIATGELSDEETLQLLSTMANAEIPEQIGIGDGFEQALKAVTTQPHEPIEWSKTVTYARYQASLKELSQILKNNNMVLNKKDLTQQLVQQNKTYFWVQYRSNPTDQWHDAHPAFNQTVSNPAIIQPDLIAHFDGSVPEEYHHRLKIEAFIEQRVGTNFKQHRLMKPWIKPVANLQDRLITYSNAPSAVNLQDDYDLEKILDKSTFFIPTFNGIQVGGKVFDTKGRMVDSDAMNNPAGALFQSLSDKSLSAMDKLNDMSSEQDAEKATMQLTRQWLVFTFIQPDGTEYVQERSIYQAPSNSEIDETSIKMQLMTEYALLVNSGEVPNAYLAKVYLDLVESGLPLLKASAKKVFNPEQKVGFPKEITRNEFELLSQYYWMQQNPDINKKTIQFRSQANLLGFKRGYINPETAFLAVDIIANKQQFIQKQGRQFFNDPQSAFVQGVWETACEWIPSQIIGVSGHSVDTLKVAQLSKEQDIDFKIYQPIESDQAQLSRDFQNNTPLLNRITADINQGYAVAIPAQRPKGLSMTGWWRINPDTGETLGMIGNGGGSEITEYLIENVQTALSLVRAVGGLKKCTDDNSLNNYEKMCCLAEAHFNNVGGMAFGSVLSGSIGTAGAALFDIADFTSEIVTGTGLAPNTQGQICQAVGPIPTF